MEKRVPYFVNIYPLFNEGIIGNNSVVYLSCVCKDSLLPLRLLLLSLDICFLHQVLVVLQLAIIHEFLV